MIDPAVDARTAVQIETVSIVMASEFWNWMELVSFAIFALDSTFKDSH